MLSPRVLARRVRIWLGEAAVHLFPSSCFVCGGSLPRVQLLGACMACWAALAANQRSRCARCALPLPNGSLADGPARGCCARCAIRALPFDRAVAAVDYDASASRFLLRAKNGQRPELLGPLGGQLAAAVQLSGLAQGLDGIVPVPSSRNARWRRGFEPSRELAVVVARATQLPLMNGVLRKRGFGGPAMKTLKAPARRLGAGRHIKIGRNVTGARILLVDDVLTTGATAAACSLALRSAGAAEIRVAVWARTPFHAARFDHSRQARL